MFFGGFRDGSLFEINMALKSEVKALKHTIEEFKSGKRYLKIQKDHSRVVKGYIKEIERLKKEVSAAHAQAVTVRKIWTDECDRIWQEHLSEMARKDEKIRKLEDRLWDIQAKSDEKITALTQKYEGELHEKECVIEELKNKLAHAEALLGRDSTNTGLPTGQTPPGKEKHIPNSRRSSGKKKGGQPGHKKHALEKPPAEEVTDEIEHPLEEGQRCPACGSENLIYTGEYEERYEIDIEIIVKKKLHKFWKYQCMDCGETVRAGIVLFFKLKENPILRLF